MMGVSSEGYHGCPGNWVRLCDVCRAASCTIYCHNDACYLCNYCDKSIHPTDSVTSAHDRVWVCTACQNTPAAFTCTNDAIFLCVHCDNVINLGNPTGRVPIPPFYGGSYACSSTCQYEFPGTTMNIENETLANSGNEVINEAISDSGLWLEPAKKDGPRCNEYMNIKGDNANNEYLCPDESNQNHFYSGHSGFNGSDSVVPVGSFEGKVYKHEQQQQGQFSSGHPYRSGSDTVVPVQRFELNQQPQIKQTLSNQQQAKNSVNFNREHEVPIQAFKAKQQLQLPHNQHNHAGQILYFNTDYVAPVQCYDMKQQQINPHYHQQQVQQNTNFTTDYESSKAACLEMPSSTQNVTMSFTNSGVFQEGTSGISNAYTDFPEHKIQVPDQYTEMNREAKVRRYREKRKTRKFPKKVAYVSRKAYAETRPRVKGRFARKSEMKLEEDQLFSVEDISKLSND